VTDTITPPRVIPNQVDGEEQLAEDGATLAKHAPHDGRVLWELARSGTADVAGAVEVARERQPGWALTPAPARGEQLFALADLLEAHTDGLADIIARETGKSPSEARGEIGGAVTLGRFFAGEGTRMYGRTTTSAVATKQVSTVREPIGVAALIVGPNTPIANLAWKSFPALICGNSCVLKAAEHAPATAWHFGELVRRAGLPDGVCNIVQGLGEEAGRALVADERVEVISFTGSTAVGREIAQVAAGRLARVSLELGGKNPMVICDDADLDSAVDWAVKSAFSNAGQRCASGSRIIVTDGVYDRFVEALIARTEQLEVGPEDGDDLGPVIAVEALERMLAHIDSLDGDGARILVGGHRLDDPDHASGYYLAPTVVELARPDHHLSEVELFGPIAQLYRVDDYPQALALANLSPYGLTAAIHTRDFDRAMHFVAEVSSGVATVNGGTYGSEPHMPFGGRRASGNGTREPGTEALDVYSELKCVYLWVDDPAV